MRSEALDEMSQEFHRVADARYCRVEEVYRTVKPCTCLPRYSKVRDLGGGWTVLLRTYGHLEALSRCLEQ